MLPALAPLLLALFLFCAKTCHYAGVAARRSGGSWQTRIITDQISDISRGMNVLWCVFYFISLSYNPPANGARSLPLPRARPGWGWWQWCIFHATHPLCLSLFLFLACSLGACVSWYAWLPQRKEAPQLRPEAAEGGREMSNAKLRKHGSKIG